MQVFHKKLFDAPFQALLSGKKTIELRANKNDATTSENSVNSMYSDDKIIFTNVTSQQKLSCTVVRKTLYSTAQELFLAEGLEKTISADVSSIDKAIALLYEIPRYEELIKKNGVFAIEVTNVALCKKRA